MSLVAETIVIYGHSLDAYTCIQTLLSSDVRGDQIILVTPTLNSEVNMAKYCFSDFAILELVLGIHEVN